MHTYHLSACRYLGWFFCYNGGNGGVATMGLTYYGYPKCGTCRKAKKWLETNGLDFQEVNIAENPPTEKELQEMIAVSGLEIKKFFNISGMNIQRT